MLEICEVIGLENLKFSPVNPRGFRKPGILWEYTEEEKRVIDELSSHPAFFLEKMVTVDKGRISLYDFQKIAIMRAVEKNFFQLVWPRQLGASMIARALALFWSFQGKKVAIVEKQGSTLAETLEKIQQAYIDAPLAFKPGVVYWNKFSVKFDNDGEIECLSRNFTSKSFDVVIADLPYEWQISGVMPCLSKDGYFLLIDNTPNEHFSHDRKSWKILPGRDDNWKQNEIRKLGSTEAFVRKYGEDYVSENDIIFKTEEIRSKINAAIDELLELHKKRG
jgi:hypothetical protein